VIAGLILAAGAGSRFDSERSKLLATLDGRPLLEWAVRAACAVPELERVVVVLGARAEEVRVRVDFGRAETTVCRDWEDGQSASLRHGVGVLGEPDKVIVLLGDEPLVTPAAIARFLDEPGGARAVYGDRPGHPAVLGPEQLAAIGQLEGDRGARDLLARGPRIEAGHLCSAADVDTPEDLEAISGEARAVI
jgi:CTP:molybdopterin cytidylyltransferase MocA